LLPGRKEGRKEGKGREKGREVNIHKCQPMISAIQNAYGE
jgi:hypothetical protein